MEANKPSWIWACDCRRVLKPHHFPGCVYPVFIVLSDLDDTVVLSAIRVPLQLPPAPTDAEQAVCSTRREEYEGYNIQDVPVSKVRLRPPACKGSCEAGPAPAMQNTICLLKFIPVPSVAASSHLLSLPGWTGC